jgi:DNA-binding MarR family transcriptional regulator
MGEMMKGLKVSPVAKTSTARLSARGAVDAKRKTDGARPKVKRRALGPIGSLDDFIPYKLAVVANRVSQSIGHVFETQFNLQMPEWRILMALYAYGALIFNEVVERTSMDKARVSRAQRRLVDLNMIKTSDHPTDGRRLILALTPTGVRRCADILPEAAEREAWFLSALTDEEHKQLDVILNKLMARSQEMRDGIPGVLAVAPHNATPVRQLKR